MATKIVVLNGSPRDLGNTSALVREFAVGAKAAGHDVTVFQLDRMNIRGCKGCFGGGKNLDHPCMQHDDMDKIYPVYREADVVVLATPLYYWNFSGQLRTAFDRLFAVAECNPHYRNPKKDAVLLMAAEGYGFDDVKRYYKNLMRHLGWASLGEVLVGGVIAIGDINGRKELQEARLLGQSIKTSDNSL